MKPEGFVQLHSPYVVIMNKNYLIKQFYIRTSIL